MNAAESLFRTAARAGVRICFANPGTTEMPLVAALDAVPEIRSVLCLFEGVCTGAADGWGRMTGSPATTLLHLGPGFANGIANLHNARRAQSPVVNLIGDHASWHLGYDPPLTSDIESLARPVSAWQRITESADAMARDMADAVVAASGPPGRIASLVLPADFQAQTTASAPAPPASTPERPIDAARIEDVATRLRGLGEETSVTLLLGAEGLCERGLHAAARVAERCGARLVGETFPARWERGAGLPPVERLPYFPEQAIDFLSGDALVVLAGARPPVAFFGYEGVDSELVDEARCEVLATPGDDATAALEALADSLAEDTARPGPSPAPAPPAPPMAGPINAFNLGACLTARLPEGAIVVDEAATSSLPLYLFGADGPRHSVLTLTGGAIGQGLPCATGAALACPDRRVIAFQADGSAMYTLQALWTQAREGLDVTTLLCSNRAYKILQVELARAGIAEPGAKARALTGLDQPELDWCALARGMGVPATRVEDAGALDAAIARALTEPGPQLIEVML